jgi:predicted AAA+ superfamily ATPase
MKDLNIFIKQMHTEFLQAIPKSVYPRSVKLLEQKDLISCVLGPRRSGKTYLLFEKINRLIADGVPVESILYINFEDDRLPDFNSEKFGQAVDAFLEVFPDNFMRKTYFFFDEIQNIDGWSKPLRRFLDKLNCQIYITGSSSKLLSREMTTSLRGRTITTVVYPLSYSEHFIFSKKTALDLKSKQDLVTQKKHLFNFLFSGGFPLILKAEQENRQELLKEFISLVIFKDVVERFQVQNTIALEYIVKFCVRNQGKLFSGTKLLNDIKSQGISFSKDKLYAYLEHLNDAFLLFYIPLFTESVRKQNSNSKKIFCIDTALSSVYEFRKDQDVGRKFENLIFLELLRNKYNVAYYLTVDGEEVDFIISKPGEDSVILQICWDASDETTYKREVEVLNIAKKELKLEGYLITAESYLQKYFISILKKD